MTKTDITITESNIKAQLDGKYIAPIVLAGSPGTGKTSTVKLIAQNNNYNLVNVSIAGLAVEQLSGIPSFVNAPQLDKYSTIGHTNVEITRWSVPEIIETANTLAQDKPTILLLDDLHELTMATQPYMLEFLLERKLGGFSLDPNVAIVATMNDSDEANFDGMASPVRNRLAIHKLEFNYDYWYDTHGKFLHFYISSFIKTHGSYVNEEESTGIEGFGTPRAYDFLSNTFHSHNREFVVTHATTLAKQYISVQASLALNKHIQYMETIDFTFKIKNREPIDIDALKPLDQMLYAYIINYIKTIEDAEYLINLINSNNSDSFLGFLLGELVIKYKLLTETKENQSNGVRMILDALLGENSEGFIDIGKLTTKEKKIYESTKFDDRQELVKTAMEYL